MPHMYSDGWWFFGMHALWWLFWLVLIVLFVWLVGPALRGQDRIRRETPLEVLERRYAAGEISTEDYEERKARLGDR